MTDPKHQPATDEDVDEFLSLQPRSHEIAALRAENEQLRAKVEGLQQGWIRYANTLAEEIAALREKIAKPIIVG